MRRAAAYIVIVAAVVGGAVMLTVHLTSKRGPDSAGGGAEAAAPVAVAPVSQRQLRNEISAVGTLQPRETSLLSPKVAGNVEAVLVDLGDIVKADQVVVRLDRTNYELARDQARAAKTSAEATIAQLKAQFEQAQKAYHRASNLLADNVIPEGRFEAAEANYKASREALAAAKARYKQAEAALQTAEQYLKDTEVRSPIGGQVVGRWVEVGQAVGPAARMLRIVDQSTLKADVDLPGTDFGRVSAGTPVVVTVDAFPGRRFPARVSVVNPAVDPRTRTFRARIRIPNPAGKLVEGMFARVHLLVGKRDALVVPRDALLRLPGSGSYSVFVMDGDEAVKRNVKVGSLEDRWAEIVDGLDEGEMVVTQGAGRLRSGMKVAVSPQKAGEPAAATEEFSR